MKSKQWIQKWILLIMFFPLLVGFNYLIDPYEVFNHKLFSLEKTKQAHKIRLSKIQQIKINSFESIVLGTSRSENAFDPKHSYFKGNSYNLGLSGASMYETLQIFKLALQKGELKNVLLVTDWIMFNSQKEIKVSSFNKYLSDQFNIYSLLLSSDMLKDSFSTIIDTIKGKKAPYLSTGQLRHDSKQNSIMKHGGHLKVMKKEESKYYKEYKNKNIYGDTQRNAFDDFKELLKLCLQNNIKLDIIFGPSHVRQWEAFNYYHGYETLLKWKKNIVKVAQEVTMEYGTKPFHIIDFAVYHKLTSETIPLNKSQNMFYHWEGSHYKNSLGNIILDKLNGKSIFPAFGQVLTMNNIDEHLEKLKKDRQHYMNVSKYYDNFEKYLNKR